MSEKIWVNVEDKVMVESVLGAEACQFLISLASDNVLSNFIEPVVDLGVQQGLCKLVEGSNWNYAIFWHIVISKSGGLALIWGDGNCRNPNDSGAVDKISRENGNFDGIEKEAAKKRMRLKKQRRVRKSLRIYITCFGFRKPFKVLCDGTFVHHLLVNRIVPADDSIASLLGGPVKLFTTSCVLTELRRLGQSYSQSLDAANNLTIARCEHDKPKAADACIAEVIGETNPEHFFVASQDGDLRRKFQEMHAVPIIFALRNALFLEPVSASLREHAKTLDKELSHVSESEHNMLRKRVEIIKEELEDQNLPVQAVKKTRKGRNGMWVKDKVQFKRKSAKGPNPLSCKKKKKPENKNPVPVKKEENGTKRSRTRNRKRSRTHTQSASAEN